MLVPASVDVYVKRCNLTSVHKCSLYQLPTQSKYDYTTVGKDRDDSLSIVRQDDTDVIYLVSCTSYMLCINHRSAHVFGLDWIVLAIALLIVSDQHHRRRHSARIASRCVSQRLRGTRQSRSLLILLQQRRRANANFSHDGLNN